jgi:hypothetical protein
MGKLNDTKHLSRFDIWTGRHGKYDSEWVRRFVVDETASTQHGHEQPEEAEPTVGDDGGAALVNE